MMSDDDFVLSLKKYLSEKQGIPIPAVETPLFCKSDGSIDREKTLALPCYQNFIPQVIKKAFGAG